MALKHTSKTLKSSPAKQKQAKTKPSTRTRSKQAPAAQSKRTPLSVAFSVIEPTWRAYIHFVELGAAEGNEDCKAVMEVWEALSSKVRSTIMPEDLADKAGIKPSELLGAVCAQLWNTKSNESAMIAAMSHPKVIRQTAKAANNIKFGGRDRELFFRVTGSLPDKKGASVVIHNNPQMALVNSSGGDDNSPSFLPSMEQDVLSMDKLLEDPNTINVTPIHMVPAAVRD